MPPPPPPLPVCLPPTSYDTIDGDKKLMMGCKPPVTFMDAKQLIANNLEQVLLGRQCLEDGGVVDVERQRGADQGTTRKLIAGQLDRLKMLSYKTR